MWWRVSAFASPIALTARGCFCWSCVGVAVPSVSFGESCVGLRAAVVALAASTAPGCRVRWCGVFAQRVFFAGRFYEPMNLLTARPRPDDSLPVSTDDAPPPLHTHTAKTRPPPQRPPKAPRPPPAAPPPWPATGPTSTSKLSLRVYLARFPWRV